MGQTMAYWIAALALCGSGVVLQAGAATIAAGGSHSCAVVDGGVRCWGDNYLGQLGNPAFWDTAYATDVAGLRPGTNAGVTAVAAGSNHTCAVVNGGVQCWGSGSVGQLGLGNTLKYSSPQQLPLLPPGSGVTAIAAGNDFTCAIVSGGVKCWGDNYYGQLGLGDWGNHYTVPQQNQYLPAQSGVSAIEAGYAHTCAVVSGTALCWGNNQDGQLGLGDTSDRHVPILVIPGYVSAIALGDFHSCAIVKGGVQCWGSNGFGELGLGNVDGGFTTPQPVLAFPTGTPTPVTALAAGDRETCVASSAAPPAPQGLLCWGSNTYGQLGTGNYQDQSTPKVVGSFNTSDASAELTVGQYHACARYQGSLYCWGYKGHGQLGNGDDARDRAPHAVGLPGTTAIATGEAHSCAVVGGSIQCWGENGLGQLGVGSTQSALGPVSVAGTSGTATSPYAIAAGDYHTCAVIYGGVFCWGLNDFGQLGAGSSAYQENAPTVAILAFSGATAVTTGRYHTCAIINGGVRCWGDNEWNQLGLGTGAESKYDTPQAVSSLPANVTSIAAGETFTCAIANGGVQCWGENNYGQLGNASTIDQNSPVSVDTLYNVTAIAAGAGHVCAVVDGGVECWGANYDGQLGLESADFFSHSSPEQVPSLPPGSGVTMITAGRAHTCAVVLGEAKCWGYGDDGQLGTGTLDDWDLPATVSSLSSGVSAIAAGSAHSCAIANGAVQCWGDTTDGRVGTYQNYRRSSPQLVIVNDVIYASRFEVKP